MRKIFYKDRNSMHPILIFGAGKIGSLISFLLAQSDDYLVHLADIQFGHSPAQYIALTKNLQCITLDAQNTAKVAEYVKKNKIEAILSCLPYYANTPIAQIAASLNIHYLDLTEDVETTQNIRTLAKNAKCSFAPQCGLAPGFINIVANHLMQHFPTLDTVKLRVGALPINISNALQYSLTWSTDGLINEYGNLCQAVENGEQVTTLPLDDLEEIKIDGLTYEAFNTSGGVGSLVDTYLGKVKHLSYKTIRYPGHCRHMRFLMNDLHLNQDRHTLKRILENALPKTYQDVVLVYVSVTGIQDNQFIEENYVKKFYPKKMGGLRWSAIQLTTAYGICSLTDMIFNHPEKILWFCPARTIYTR